MFDLWRTAFNLPMRFGVNRSKPLANFSLIRSRNIEEVREAIAHVYVTPDLQPMHDVAGLNATVNNCRLRHIQLAYTAYGADVRFEFAASGFFSLLLPLCGTGEIVCGKTLIALAAGTGAVIPPDVAHKARYGADYEQLVMRVDAPALTEKLAAMTGAQIAEPLQMSPQQSFGHPAAQMLQQYLPMLVDTLGETTPPFPEWWIAQTEQFLLTLFLCGHRHSYSHLLEREMPDAVARQVRQAEEYIEANAQRAVSLEELAEVTGMSVLGLFGAFKKYRGYSPLRFLAQVQSRRRGMPR